MFFSLSLFLLGKFFSIFNEVAAVEIELDPEQKTQEKVLQYGVGTFDIADAAAEKEVISENAAVGVYGYKSGKMFVKYAEKMIDENIRTKGEFYVCPLYNEALLEGARVKTFHIDKMWGLGTPEDLDTFLKHDINSS